MLARFCDLLTLMLTALTTHEIEVQQRKKPSQDKCWWIVWTLNFTNVCLPEKECNREISFARQMLMSNLDSKFYREVVGDPFQVVGKGRVQYVIYNVKSSV